MAVRYNETREGVQRRYFELRFDGERKLTGTVMRYGDVAELPWGEKERFEPGAFGEVAAADVILNVMHDRSAAIARTGGGGLMLRDTSSALQMEAVLPESRDADDALVKVRGKILRGLSVEFRPDQYRVDEKAGMLIHERAVLRNIGVVDRPAYEKSAVEARRKGSSMDEEKVKRMIEESLAASDDKTTLDPAALAKGISTEVRSEIDAALQKRDEAEAERVAAEAEAEQKRSESEAAAKKTEDEHKAELEAVRAEATRRGDLLLRFGALMPEGTDTSKFDAKAILVAAVGDEVEKPEERSEDYLEAKAEVILERRDKAQVRQPGGPAPARTQPTGNAPVNIFRMIENRAAQRAAGR